MTFVQFINSLPGGVYDAYVIVFRRGSVDTIAKYYYVRRTEVNHTCFTLYRYSDFVMGSVGLKFIAAPRSLHVAAPRTTDAVRAYTALWVHGGIRDGSHDHLGH